jgi:DNA polymerase epsilon subunit 1
MLSYMLDGAGFLIVNREVVTEDIEPFEYTPKPEYEGHFVIFNVADEAALLRKWFDEMRAYRPMVYATYNGDYFDFPFIEARSQFHGMNMKREIGFAQNVNAEGATLNLTVPHLDCFYWVKRDSYLPQGSQGLKAVTKYKLGYDPVEVDPEEMLPLAQNQPQRMAAYSVSDAVATYYLYMKYVHPFIFSLCTIIPMAGDDVLRKGSGTLCESLLCVQAYALNVVFPNKQVTIREKFHNGHLLDRETYVGGRVEALKSGVYRASIPMRFECVPSTVQLLMDNLDGALKWAIEKEGVKMSEVTNYDEVHAEITERLAAIRDKPVFDAAPLIYHLDVGAMYPNIILTNRLQPPSMVTPEICAACTYNTPDDRNKCKKPMQWIWRGEMFAAKRQEFNRIKSQLEQEAFTKEAVQTAETATATKKAYGNKRGNVLEGTSFEKKKEDMDEWRKRREAEKKGGGGYRKGQRSDGMDPAMAGGRAKSDDDGSGSDDEGGAQRFTHLEENARFALLKTRISEYSRKAYKKVHVTEIKEKTHVVCQRENTFFVDTVRLFRDRRYEYKAGLKKWKGFLDKAIKDNDDAGIKEGKTRCVQMESLQLAHKCILNSFYGYVMRKGSRWYSMEMGGIVTCLGATLIQMARALVQHIGVTLELDTDGIWCCLPAGFPEDFTIKTSNPKKGKVGISYPCLMLNKDVYDRYTNHQYQDQQADGTYAVKSECSIEFEVDGPYSAMLLPASREKGKGIKKRYAVFHLDGRLAELKGFELKRRGELMLIKDFQSRVFSQFLHGQTLEDAYGAAAAVAQDALDLLHGKGEGYTDEEVLAKLTESSNLSRRLSEYPPTQKSLGLTTARRIGEFLGPQMVKDKGLNCSFVISRLPPGRPVTERAIPLVIFKADPETRVRFIRDWTNDTSYAAGSSLAQLLDWDYYIQRMNSCVQKIITIPAALQGITNPVPCVKHPDWLAADVAEANSRLKQRRLTDFFTAASTAAAIHKKATAKRQHRSGLLADLEDVLDLGDAGVEGVAGDRDDRSSGDDRDDVEDAGFVAENTEAQRHRLAAAALLEEEARSRKRRADQYRQAFFTRTGPPAPATQGGAAAAAAAVAPYTVQSGFRAWLGEASNKWVQRAQLRRRMAALGVGADEAPEVAEAKAQALEHPWHILEVRDEPHTTHRQLKVFALIDGKLRTFRCGARRHVYVDFVSAEAAARVLPTLFPTDHEQRARVAGGRILPRHAPSTHLIDISLEKLDRIRAERVIAQLQQNSEDVAGVYHAHLGDTFQAVIHTGCVATVQQQPHLARVQQLMQEVNRLTATNNRRAATLMRQSAPDFMVADLVDAATTVGLPVAATAAAGQAAHGKLLFSSYLQNLQLSTCFVFHVGAAGAAGSGTATGARGTLAVLFSGSAGQDSATSGSLLIVVQPAGAQAPQLQLRQLYQDAATACGFGATDATTILPRVVTASDWPAAFAQAQGAIEAWSAANPSLNLAVVHSTAPSPDLVRVIPALHHLPIVRVPGAQADRAAHLVGQGYNPLTWARDLTRTMYRRLLLAPMRVASQVGVARVSGIPLCNVPHDGCIAAWDMLYARVLTRFGHVLWDPSCFAGVGEAPETRRMEAAQGGGYMTWSIELALAHLDLVSVLHSRTIQEGDDVAALSQLEDSSRVTSQFGLLRDVASALFAAATHGSDVAQRALEDFPRWLRCTAAACYEPKIVTVVNVLAARAMAACLQRVVQLGARIVFASKTRLVLATNKYDLQDARHFAEFLTRALSEAPLLRFLVSHVHRLWYVLIVQDAQNWLGSYLPVGPNGADGAESSGLQLDTHLPAIAHFPDFYRERVLQRMQELVHAVEDAKSRAAEDFIATVGVAAAATIPSAQRFEMMTKLTQKAVGAILNDLLQPALIADTDELVSNDRVRHTMGASRVRAIASQGAAAVCALMQRIEGDASVSRRTLSSCLRLCGLSPFGVDPSAALWQSAASIARRATTLEVRCPHCREEVRLDLAASAHVQHDANAGGATSHSVSSPPAARRANPTGSAAAAVLASAGEAAAVWPCPNCSTPFNAAAVEATAVNLVHMHVERFNAQEYVCTRCRLTRDTVAAKHCTCGAALVPRHTPAELEQVLRRFELTATLHGLVWLQDVVYQAQHDLILSTTS